MIIGKLICEKCGCDCSNLYGYALATRGTVRNKQTQDELDKVKKEFGKCEFYFCWSCTAKAFGVKPLEPEPKQQEAVIDANKKTKTKE
jgi:hypothetical protein